uniref:Uncharacterized protein n=1 Tax=Romanomermis culicivorax TaxID=13658 RepID=A0A915KFM2_ROMCU
MVSVKKILPEMPYSISSPQESTLLLPMSQSGNRHANQQWETGGADKFAWQWSAKERRKKDDEINLTFDNILVQLSETFGMRKCQYLRRLREIVTADSPEIMCDSPGQSSKMFTWYKLHRIYAAKN